MFDISDKEQSKITRIDAADTEIFAELVEIAELDPKQDFIHANLQHVDFTGSDLTSFNFKFADLRGAKWESGIEIEPSFYIYALRGRRFDPILATDYDKIFERASNARTWCERFLAFSLLVDNFGEVDLNLGLLAKILDDDRSKYMRHSAYLYFIGSYLRHDEAMKYCKTMALAGNAYENMYRFKKLNRLLIELHKYINTIKRTTLYPGQVSPQMISKYFDILM